MNRDKYVELVRILDLAETRPDIAQKLLRNELVELKLQEWFNNTEGRHQLEAMFALRQCHRILRNSNRVEQQPKPDHTIIRILPTGTKRKPIELPNEAKHHKADKPEEPLFGMAQSITIGVKPMWEIAHTVVAWFHKPL